MEYAPILQYGVIGFMLVMIMLGQLVPKWSKNDVEKDRDNWKDAFERESVAHETTRQALYREQSRSEISTAQGALTAHLLEELKHPKGPGGGTNVP